MLAAVGIILVKLILGQGLTIIGAKPLTSSHAGKYNRLGVATSELLSPWGLLTLEATSQ